MDKLVEEAKKIRIGNPLEMSTQIGAVTSKEHFDKIMSYIEKGKQEGAKLVLGGDKAGGELSNGLFINPTIFEAEQGMSIAKEEIFGPVLSVINLQILKMVLLKLMIVNLV